MTTANTLTIGSKIKTFQVMNIVDGFSFNYDDKGNKTKYATKYMFLLSDCGQQRVLEVGKTNLNDCVRYMPTFGKKMKFIDWSQF